MAGCGGSQVQSNSSMDGELSSPDGVAQAASGDAGEGAPCDYGGAARMTCTSGLTCCYPESGEVQYGTCSLECGE